MADDELDDSLQRLQILQRDLIAFTESRLPNLERLAIQLDSSTEDFKKLLERKRKSDASRKIIAPNTTPPPATITIDTDDLKYNISPQLSQCALQVADELDLDELEAVKLCIRSTIDNERDQHDGSVLAMRAVLRFHDQRLALLECMRLMLQLSIDAEGEEDHSEAFRTTVRVLIQGERGGQNECSAYWRRCVDGLADIEHFLRKVSEYRDKLIMTGQGLFGEQGEWLAGQRLLLTRQHESMASILSYLCQANYAQPEDYRGFLSKAAGLETDLDITIHYLPVLISGAAHFASDHMTTREAARDLHNLFASGPGQLQWKQPNFRAAATMCWLAEYSARFSAGSIEINQSESDRLREEEARSKLCFDALKDKAFHLMLTAAAYLRPVVWHDPARTALIDFLVESAVVIPSDSPRPSDDFSSMTMREFQVFTDAFVTNMPDALRKLKLDEDDWRRAHLSHAPNGVPQTELDLERFMIIVACAYQDDTEAARDFWKDRESNLYGFLRWISQRLPTPRVAAFCHLLRSIACDVQSADDAHRFLLEDSTVSSGKLRKAYAVSWSQIFSELELFALSLKDRLAAPQGTTGSESNNNNNNDVHLLEPETGIMLDSYLGLATHMCRTSPEARAWLLAHQTFHIGEVMFQLARNPALPRVQACCLDLLAALLTDKVLEVRNGMWVLLDGWLTSGGLDGSSRAPQKPHYPAKHYLQAIAQSAEAAVSFIGLLNALISPMDAVPTERTIDALPFPENLGAPHRHAGIDLYVDFVMDMIFGQKLDRLSIDGEASLLDLLRYQCLHFMETSLSTFNDDLMLLANTTRVSIESTIETKSLAAYARLHPFARVMEWMFNKRVVLALLAIVQQNVDALNDADPRSPPVQTVLKTLRVLVLVYDLQPTYFDLIKPAEQSQRPKTYAVVQTWTSLDDMFLGNLESVASIALLAASIHLDIGLEALKLLQRIASSRRIGTGDAAGLRQGSRIIGVLNPISDILTLQLASDFAIQVWDLEATDAPLKALRARSVLDLLKTSLRAASDKPSIAHCLLGFKCRDRTVDLANGSHSSAHLPLFHAIIRCAVTVPMGGGTSHTSWLLSLQRGCLEVILDLATTPLTFSMVQPELRKMDFVAALAQNQTVVSVSSLWDGKLLMDDLLLLDSSAIAVRDLMHVRESYFELLASDLKAAAEQGSFSVQEKILGALLGTVTLPNGDKLATPSVFELLDFFELETAPAFVAQTKFFEEDDLSSCTKSDPETITSFDVEMAEQLLILRKRELREKGGIKDAADNDAADNEIQAILAGLTSQNNFVAIQNARLDALEAWTDLLSLIVTKGGLGADAVVTLALQGLLVVSPKYERALSDSLEAAAILAKLTLTLTDAIGPASQDDSEQIASMAMEPLLSVLRISLKAITDSSTDLVLRDVAYRTSCAVLTSLPTINTTSRTSPSASARQVLQLVQNSGERLLGVITEDAFSGRGVTRVSSLLFLDGLVSLFQSMKVTATVLRGLTKLNFVPVLIDTSIGNVAAAFQSEDDMGASLAYFHTALALLLRLCRSADGAQLVLNSGLFEAIHDSKLFSTDPDLGLDIDNPEALEGFYAILAGVLRVITAAVVQKGSQPGKAFLQQHRFTMQAIYKQAARGQAVHVADEYSRLILATDFLEDDEAALGVFRTNGFT